MHPLRIVGAGALVLALGWPEGAGAQGTDELIESSKLLVEGGGRVAFSAQGDRLAFDKPDADGRHDIWVMDMVTGGERCLTCKTYDLRKTSNFNPTFHPSGKSLVFQVQSSPRRLRIDALEMTTPNRAVHSDLYTMLADGSDYYQLTRASENGSAVLDPHFSYEGDQLLWSERVTSRGRGFGEWRLQIAKVATKRGIVRLKSGRRFVPGKGLVIPHEFSPDESKVLLSAAVGGLPEAGTDVFLFDLASKELTRLTHTSRGREAVAHFSATGANILFTAERSIDPLLEDQASNKRLLLPGNELWMMNADGTQKRQVTRLFEEHGRVTIGDFDVSPDGRQIALHLVFGAEEPRQAIYLLRTGPALHRGMSN